MLSGRSAYGGMSGARLCMGCAQRGENGRDNTVGVQTRGGYIEGTPHGRVRR